MKYRTFFLLMTLLLSSAKFCFSQLNCTLLGSFPYAQNLGSVWGYTDGNGNEYALVGVYAGLSIVNVTNPAVPVQTQLVPTSNSSWHEIKTWSHYAYVVNENGGGLLIVDLSSLPGICTYIYWTGGTLGLSTGHTIFIDENGIAYINGSNLAGGGVIFLNLASNPGNPTYLGAYDDFYVHDCFARGDTMWTAEIYEGLFRAINVSSKVNPVPLQSQITPGEFTHNCWLSDDGKYLFTTDEVSNSYITAYNVSDLSNITEVDRFQANPGTNSIVHNTHVKENFLVNAYYRDGVVITDATFPNNLIKVGYYDTSPLSGSGYNGCWGVYPYLPSGNILAADIEEGLFIIDPVYVQACYLSGIVTDYSSGLPINGATVTIVNGQNGSSTSTNLSGSYATGNAAPGGFSVQFSKSGYYTKTVSVNLQNGVSTILNVTLKSTSLPLCSAPISLTTSNVSSNGATFNWSDESANNYKITVRNLTSGGNLNYVSSSNSKTITNLSACTHYKFRVRAICPDGSKPISAWKHFLTSGCKLPDENVMPENELSVYPNPFSGKINIQFYADQTEIILFSIYDLSGKLLIQSHDMYDAGYHSFEIDGSNFLPGVYLLRIQMGDEIITKKVVKAE